jgi:hypothetical protein
MRFLRSKSTGRQRWPLLAIIALTALVAVGCGFGGPSELEIRATIDAENAATAAAIPPTPVPPPTAVQPAQPAKPVASSPTQALTATSTTAVNVQTGPLFNCNVVANWPASQTGTLLARVDNPDGTVYYKTVAPGSTTVGYVFSGQNGANFTVQGDPNTLPRETVTDCQGGTGAAPRPTQAGQPTVPPAAPTLASQPTAPAATPVNCGAFGDGGIYQTEDFNSCTYYDELYDLCGNVQVSTGPLDPAVCNTFLCGNYGDGGCDPEYVVIACAGAGTFETIEGVCYDLCGNPEFYQYDLVC